MCFLTQFYDVQSVCVSKSFILTLAAELNFIQGRKWNAEQVIVFQTVILQRVRLVTGTKNIRVQINTRLYPWNIGAFDELVNDSCAAAVGYMGRAHGNQNLEQRHCTFSNFVLCGKFFEAVIFFCERESGGGG